MKKVIFIMISILLLSSASANAAVKKANRLWQDESIYSIMIDRFNDGDTTNNRDADRKNPNTYNGGDFQGIIDKLDYIHNMGFTAIRLTPIFDNASKGYHGYWVNDFYKTDEHFGSIATFEKLVKEAHKRKMKVIIDFVTNNVAPNQKWVSDPAKQTWFHPKLAIHKGSNQKELENGWADGLPDLNQDNPAVKKYLIDAAKWWIKKTDIDGYSLPEVNMVPVTFWRDFSKDVKSVKKNFFLIGEMAKNTQPDLKNYENAGIDSMYNGQLSNDLRGAFANTDQSFAGLDKTAHSYLSANFLDNENTTRFTHDIVENRQLPGARWQMALAYLFTTPGIPVVYYGSEIALNGGNIPDNRQQMTFREDTDIIDYLTKLGELRNQLPSLTRGTFEVIYEKPGMVVYKRFYKGETSVIAINNTKKSQDVSIPTDKLKAGKELRGLLGGDKVNEDRGHYKIILDRDNAEIYVLADKSGLNIPLIASLTIVYILVGIFLVLLFKRRRRFEEK